MIVMVTEYISGGDMHSLIQSKKRLQDKEAQGYFRQIIAAVAYMHKHGFAHLGKFIMNSIVNRYQTRKYTSG